MRVIRIKGGTVMQLLYMIEYIARWWRVGDID